MAAWMIAVSFMMLIGIGAIHVYWAFGGTWGVNVVLPKSTAQDSQAAFLPGKALTLIVAFLLFSAALLLTLQGGLLALVQPNFLVKWGCWACFAVFGLRVVGDFKYFGLFKKVRNSHFSVYDTYLYTPLCLWLCITFYIAIQIGG